jgi:hypothetical protein
MPNPTIDLQRDCELFVDFDSDYFDSQRNKILDRSGNGRHPEAQGGPTLGANGPDGFEAVSFDGSDDRFSLDNSTLAGTESSGYTISFSINITQDVSGFPDIITAAQAGQPRIETTPGEELQMFVADTTGGAQNSGRISFSGFGTFSAVMRPEGFISLTLNGGETVETNDFGEDIEPVTGISDLNQDTVSMEMSFFILHSRALNDAEIDYLNRLTEPRRAQL